MDELWARLLELADGTGLDKWTTQSLRQLYEAQLLLQVDAGALYSLPPDLLNKMQTRVTRSSRHTAHTSVLTKPPTPLSYEYAKYFEYMGMPVGSPDIVPPPDDQRELVFGGQLGLENDTAGWLTPDLVGSIDGKRFAVVFEDEGCFLHGSDRLDGRAMARRRAVGKLHERVVGISEAHDKVLDGVAGGDKVRAKMQFLKSKLEVMAQIVVV